MKILVVDVAAESGGALTILNQFYEEFLQDSSNEYVLCVSKASLQSTRKVKVLTFPWVKKSWLRRLWFEYYTAQRIIKRLHIDEVLSLQNLALSFTNKPQTVYLHQSLPFEDTKFPLLKEPLFWVYQNIIGLMIIQSVKKAKRIIVQTQWMKAAIVNKCKVDEAKVEVCPPTLNVHIPRQFSIVNWRRDFFYPATALIYKNHETLFKAMCILKQQGIIDYRVLLTVDRGSLPLVCAPYLAQVQENVVFLGVIPHKEVMLLYCSSVLVFPSYIESYALAFKEARLCEAPIIASDRPFSREILSDYEQVVFFPPLDDEALAASMMVYLNNKPQKEGNE